MTEYRKESGKPVSIDHAFVHDKKCELMDQLGLATQVQENIIKQILHDVAYHEADTHDQGLYKPIIDSGTPPKPSQPDDPPRLEVPGPYKYQVDNVSYQFETSGTVTGAQIMAKIRDLNPDDAIYLDGADDKADFQIYSDTTLNLALLKALGKEPRFYIVPPATGG